MALPIFQRTVVNEAGDIIPSAQIEVRLESSGALATVYSDRDGLIGLSNPFFADPSGLARFYCNPDEYKITATGNSQTIEWRYVVIIDTNDIAVIGDNIADINTVADNIQAVIDAPQAAANAASSATAAQASLDEFQGQYHGSLATAPTVGVDTGDLYFDTVLSEMRVYNGTAWVSAGSTVNGTATRQTYTATAGQTAFTVTGGYDAGFADVYLNGVKLVNGVDVGVSSGTGFTLTTGATAGDNVDFIGYGAFEVADTYTQAEIDAKDALKVDLADTSYYQQNNILGTVSQSGGVPIGAIIERGSNVNGEYVKYADGTMICIVQFTQPLVAHTSLSGNLYWAGGYYTTQTYPAVFSALPNVHITVQPVSGFGATWAYTDGGATTTSPGIISSLASGSLAVQDMICNITAVGRWF